MNWLLVILLITLHSVMQSTDLAIKNFEVQKISSKGSNTVTFDIIDDTTFDVQYQTECTDCKCYVVTDNSSSEKINDISFNNKVSQQYVYGNKVYLIHTADSGDVSYSILEVDNSNNLNGIAKEVSIPSFKGLKNAKFSYNALAFVAYNHKSVIVNTINNQDQLEEKTLTFVGDTSADDQDQVLDMIYNDGVLYLAKGKSGLDVITLKDASVSTLQRNTYSISDLEMKDGSEIQKLEISPEEKLLYAYQPNSNNNLILALDISNPSDITLFNDYNLGITNIVQILAIKDQVHLVYKTKDEFYYLQSSPKSTEEYSNLDLQKLWKIPSAVQRIQKNRDQVLVETDNYIYLIKKDIIYETATSEFITDIVEKKLTGISFLLINQDSDYLLTVDSSTVTLSSITEPAKKPTFECGIFKQDYSGTENFSVFVYKSSCPEITDQTSDKVCSYRYQYEVSFTGNDFKDFKENSLALLTLPISNWNQNADDGTVSPPDELIENGKTDDTKSGNKNPNKPPTWVGDDDDTKIPQEPVEPEIRPNLIDPDAAYNDQLNSEYALLLVIIVSVIFFGCLIKCLCDFSKNSRNRLDAHVELEEEDESGEYKGSGDVELVGDQRARYEF